MELNCLKGISVEMEFEMSVTELVDYGVIIVIIFIGHQIANFGLFLKC